MGDPFSRDELGSIWVHRFQVVWNPLCSRWNWILGLRYHGMAWHGFIVAGTQMDGKRGPVCFLENARIRGLLPSGVLSFPFFAGVVSCPDVISYLKNSCDQGRPFVFVEKYVGRENTEVQDLALKKTSKHLQCGAKSPWGRHYPTEHTTACCRDTLAPFCHTNICPSRSLPQVF